MQTSCNIHWVNVSCLQGWGGGGGVDHVYWKGLDRIFCSMHHFVVDLAQAPVNNPSKYEMVNQCWFHVGLLSATLDQHYITYYSIFLAIRLFFASSQQYVLVGILPIQIDHNIIKWFRPTTTPSGNKICLYVCRLVILRRYVQWLRHCDCRSIL